MQVEEVLKRAQEDPALLERIRENPTEELRRLAGPVYMRDAWVYRIVVTGLASVVLIGVVAGAALAAIDKSAPEILIALGSASVGALAGLLAPSPQQGPG